MLIGNCEIKTCNDCPAFGWAGENTTKGDMGWRCELGAFEGLYDYKNVQIHENCPIKGVSKVDNKNQQGFDCVYCGDRFKVKIPVKMYQETECPHCKRILQWLGDEWY